LIITRTPFRISFFGGGTDYPDWYRKNGGAVLSTTIDKYCYITCRKLPPFFEHKHRIVYSKIENVIEINEIEHPAVRAILNWMKVNNGLEIHHDGDLPARSGLGSSSSFTVGLIHALYGMQGKLISKDQLAQIAINIEQNILGESVGSQDQTAAAYGGLNIINFHQNDSIDVRSIILSKDRQEEFHSHLMLFFTGFSRIANEIAKSKIENFKNTYQQLVEIRQMVDYATEILGNNQVPLIEIGKLLHHSWQLKRTLSNKVSTLEIDHIYDLARSAGAIGGKLLGAGGGGFILLFATPDKHNAIKEKLKKLVYVDFNFEDIGSRVVLYQPNGL
jgi:D-glycero-alpha-D-manno-heptose-7-phosphate kinase